MDLSARWQPFIEDPAGAVLLTDFDGTLSAVVPDPASARPLPGAVEVLHGLARRLRRVAVISGRPVPFLAEHVGEGLELIGLYGLESWGPGPGPVRVAAGADRWSGRIEAAAIEAETNAPDGVEIERKGLAVTLHYRNASHKATAGSWSEAFSHDASKRHGLVAKSGKMAVELVPPLDTDKGTVVETLTEGGRAAAFVGDDLGDLPAFAALDRLRPKMATIKVAVASNEMAPEVAAAADEIVDGPPGALALLQELLRVVSEP